LYQEGQINIDQQIPFPAGTLHSCRENNDHDVQNYSKLSSGEKMYIKILEGFTYVISLLSLILGVALLILALNHRTEKCPRFPVWNPKRYHDIKEWFNERGHLYNWIGASLIVFGNILFLLSRLVLFAD